MSCPAVLFSFVDSCTVPGNRSISSCGSRTSSAKNMVSSTSRSFSGRIAVRYSLPRITSVPIAALSASAIASRSRAYVFFVSSVPGAR
jgi:hypothetical protein